MKTKDTEVLERLSKTKQDRLAQKMIFITNHLAGTSYNQVTTWKPKQQLTKTTNISKSKPNETKAWFSSSFTPSDQEMDRSSSTAAWAHTGQLDVEEISSTTTTLKTQHAIQLFLTFSGVHHFHLVSTSSKWNNLIKLVNICCQKPQKITFATSQEQSATQSQIMWLSYGQFRRLPNTFLSGQWGHSAVWTAFNCTKYKTRHPADSVSYTHAHSSARTCSLSLVLVMDWSKRFLACSTSFCACFSSRSRTDFEFFNLSSRSATRASDFFFVSTAFFSTCSCSTVTVQNIFQFNGKMNLFSTSDSVTLLNVCAL